MFTLLKILFMNYTDLQVVIQEVCSQTECPSCKVNYKENDIHIVGTTKNEGVFMAKCPKCNSNVVVNVSVNRKSDKIKPHVRDWKANTTKISSDEVLDMHNFLSNFAGDVSNVLK